MTGPKTAAPRATASPRLILASASPARRRLLTSAGIAAQVIVSGVDESQTSATNAADLCLELARRKAEAVAAQLSPGNPADEDPADEDPADRDPADRTPAPGTLTPGTLILGCDSVLEFDGEILGKPADPAEATRRWQAMRGRTGQLYTGHCLLHPATSRGVEAAVATAVSFAEITDAEIAAYVASGEPLQVAGGFTIDGRGASFVDRVDGDLGNVIGLSLPTLRRLTAELGFAITDFWT